MYFILRVEYICGFNLILNSKSFGSINKMFVKGKIFFPIFGFRPNSLKAAEPIEFSLPFLLTRVAQRVAHTGPARVWDLL
jgi:hypothetical protein